jgi:uncharacterized FlaG/YvyC family protein
MDIQALNRVNADAPVATANPTSVDPATNREVVTAVQYLNKSELMADRQLKYQRDPKTGHVVVQILDRTSGEVVDQIPPETIVRMMHDLQQQLQRKDESLK